MIKVLVIVLCIHTLLGLLDVLFYAQTVSRFGRQNLQLVPLSGFYLRWKYRKGW